MLNQATLAGTVFKEVKIFDGTNAMVAKFMLVTEEEFNDKIHKTYHKIVAFNKTAEKIKKSVKEGDRLVVQGKISNSSYEDKEGNKKYETNITCLSFGNLSPSAVKHAEVVNNEDVPF